MKQGQKVDDELILALDAEGFTAPDIAVRVGCSARTVARVRARNGRSHPIAEGQTLPATPERLAAAAEMLADGAPMREVQRTVGISYHTLTKHFPGMAWTRQQCVEHALAVRHLNSITSLGKKAA